MRTPDGDERDNRVYSGGMAEPASRNHTYDEYLRIDEASEVKHEYRQGTVAAMVRGTPEHSLLKMNTGTAVRNALRGRPCRAFDSELRSVDIRIAMADIYEGWEEVRATAPPEPNRRGHRGSLPSEPG